ncbi:(2,3-dihydroxybenzoyl)adenylate synthase [Brenneria izbisi]|uniref:(2,3-dihydroxybenzoyl)adenylate synthase n=1 Tax=Brenneria izbisi TaxID=2939450 RepID=A0AA41Y3X4_9GAMM|nr:(2,3-dihydroxybenzoyl)adenylate synthase [Brenneria izbisi]MCV9880184.1 (2,3-dihydroxybenzoyl)adenylate synthase [Brenneria izbisi]MCV9883540.1 (2,3-dihydroxybenzoyl)adenylate synthase [Brenneria izbisi]
MIVEFNRWPAEQEQHYRACGYWIDRPLGDILLRHKDSDALALIDGERHFSYRELNQSVNRLAGALARRGVRRGQTALVQLGNIAEFYLTYFALLRIGVVPVNALFNHQRSELSAYTEQITPALLIVDRGHNLFHDDSFIDELRRISPDLQHVILRGEENPEYDLQQLLQQTHSDDACSPTPPDEVAFFQLSGGSTGTPKLIPRTHNDYYYSIRASVDICRFDANTRYLCALPAAHNYPLSSPGALGVFYAGGTVVMATDPSATHCFPLIERHQVNVTALVPPAVTLWLEAVALAGQGHALRSLKLLQVGGARLNEALARRIPRELGCRLQQVFGMAEGLVNYTRLDDDDDHIFTTQGCPISIDDEVWVADAAGDPLPNGQAGRLMTRGPYTFRGYYRSPQYNRQVFDEQGFYCSGDVVIRHEDGYLQVVGREKDQINRGGEKIAAEEIENLLLRHPLVINAALVAIPDALMGEKSCAFVVCRQAIKSVALRRHLREQGIADYKLPDRFESLPALPETAVGKVDKQQLRKIAQQLAQPTVAGE